MKGFYLNKEQVEFLYKAFRKKWIYNNHDLKIEVVTPNTDSKLIKIIQTQQITKEKINV